MVSHVPASIPGSTQPIIRSSIDVTPLRPTIHCFPPLLPLILLSLQVLQDFEVPEVVSEAVGRAASAHAWPPTVDGRPSRLERWDVLKVGFFFFRRPLYLPRMKHKNNVTIYLKCEHGGKRSTTWHETDTLSRILYASSSVIFHSTIDVHEYTLSLQQAADPYREHFATGEAWRHEHPEFEPKLCFYAFDAAVEHVEERKLLS